MASVNGANITLIEATPITKVSSEEVGGKLRVWHDTYEASSLASGSDITMARLPAGSTVHNVVLKADALGGSSTLIVGDSSDDNRFIDAVGTWNVAGQSQSMWAGSSTGAPVPAVTGLGYRYTSETDIVITTGGASISGTIFLWVVYSVE
jgi:hypothetical protein|tara:strand:+ start:62 stop:511 length:450 start_codon:yes stop_codon:yes gene_type:complete